MEKHFAAHHPDDRKNANENESKEFFSLPHFACAFFCVFSSFASMMTHFMGTGKYENVGNAMKNKFKRGRCFQNEIFVRRLRRLPLFTCRLIVVDGGIYGYKVSYFVHSRMKRHTQKTTQKRYLHQNGFRVRQADADFIDIFLFQV